MSLRSLFFSQGSRPQGPVLHAVLTVGLVLQVAGAADFSAELAQLASHDAARAAGAFSTLVVAGDPAVAEAAVGFAELPVAARRARAKLFAAAVSDATLTTFAGAAADPDPAVRRSLLLAFAQARLRAQEGVALRVDVLAERLARETEPELRALAFETLGRLESPRALDALERALDASSGEERTLAARALALRAAGRARVLARSERALAKEGSGDQDLLVEWLATGLGEALAERPAPAAGRDEFALVSRVARHPSAEVRASAQGVVDAYLDRLRFLGETDRAEAAFQELAGRGLDDVALRLEHARFVLEAARSPEAALAPARELARELGAGSDVTRRRALAAAHVLAGAAELCLRDFDGADASFARAAAVLDAVIEEHPERYDASLADLALDALELRGVCETWRLLTLVVAGGGPTDERVLARSLEVQRLSLRVHALAWERDQDWLSQMQPPIGSVDEFLTHRSGPARLFLLNDRAGGLSRELRLRAMRAFGEALATVAPAELPGFRGAAVAPEVSNFALDPSRRSVFDGVRAAARAQLERTVGAKRGGRRSEEQFRTFADDALWQEFLSATRSPTAFALMLAAQLRQESRPVESRELAEAVIADLERNAARGTYWATFLIARAEGAVGDSYTDENDGEAADRMLNRAYERFLGLETSMRQPGGSSNFAEALRAQRAATLTSLAVNANVKRKRPDLALEYFERSLALEQNEFSLVLLACYRARAGRVAEARALLAEIPDAPGNHYNLACTWALLGDKETALAYLARELADPDASRGSRERQKAWAKDDPDLASLRGDPRFEELVR